MNVEKSSTFHFLPLINSGLYMASKYPIRNSKFISYKSAYLEDGLCNKGKISSRILLAIYDVIRDTNQYIGYTGGPHIRKKGFQKNEFLSVYICLRVGTWFGPKFGIGRSWSSWSSRSSIHTIYTPTLNTFPVWCTNIYREKFIFLKSET